jgi:hypothetical protein
MCFLRRIIVTLSGQEPSEDPPTRTQKNLSALVRVKIPENPMAVTKRRSGSPKSYTAQVSA